MVPGRLFSSVDRLTPSRLMTKLAWTMSHPPASLRRTASTHGRLCLSSVLMVRLRPSTHLCAPAATGRCLATIRAIAVMFGHSVTASLHLVGPWTLRARHSLLSRLVQSSRTVYNSARFILTTSGRNKQILHTVCLPRRRSQRMAFGTIWTHTNLAMTCLSPAYGCHEPDGS